MAAFDEGDKAGPDGLRAVAITARTPQQIGGTGAEQLGADGPGSLPLVAGASLATH